MAALAHSIALENPLIRADVVEAEEFAALSRVYGVRSVPLTVINSAIQVLGAVSEEDIVTRVLEVGLKEEDNSDTKE